MAKKEEKTKVESAQPKDAPIVLPKSQESVENEVMKAVADNSEKPRFKGNWIDMDEKTMMDYQAKGVLIGWDPGRKQGLLKK